MIAYCPPKQLKPREERFRRYVVAIPGLSDLLDVIKAGDRGYVKSIDERKILLDSFKALNYLLQGSAGESLNAGWWSRQITLTLLSTKFLYTMNYNSNVIREIHWLKSHLEVSDGTRWPYYTSESPSAEKEKLGPTGPSTLMTDYTSPEFLTTPMGSDKYEDLTLRKIKIKALEGLDQLLLTWIQSLTSKAIEFQLNHLNNMSDGFEQTTQLRKTHRLNQFEKRKTQNFATSQPTTVLTLNLLNLSLFVSVR